MDLISLNFRSGAAVLKRKKNKAKTFYATT